jgi:hypothetical protein
VPIKGLIDKEMWYVYTTECYLAIKSEFMFFVGKWMELGIIMLSEISQSPKDNIICFILYVEYRRKKDIKVKRRILGICKGKIRGRRRIRMSNIWSKCDHNTCTHMEMSQCNALFCTINIS